MCVIILLKVIGMYAVHTQFNVCDTALTIILLEKEKEKKKENEKFKGITTKKTNKQISEHYTTTPIYLTLLLLLFFSLFCFSSYTSICSNKFH